MAAAHSARRVMAGLCAAVALAAGLALADPGRPRAEEAPVSFARLPGWADEDHAAAFAAFRLFCPAVVARKRPLTMGPADPADLVRACKMALSLPAGLDSGRARAFFERNFRPVRVGGPGEGFFTGYYEPEVAGSRARGGRFQYPLYALPPGVEALPKAADGLGASLTHGRRGADGELRPLPDRAAIDAGALAGEALELVWLADPVDVFFAHVQGSVRVRLPDGTVARYGFAGRNGHPYTAIGRVLIERGEVAREEMTADRLAAWLRAHPDEAPAVIAANRSYIFFRAAEDLGPTAGPVGALGVPLVAGRSIAVDPKENPLGVPVWVDAALPPAEGAAPRPFRRLTIAADTGAAIRGGARGDIFFGSGDTAARAAGPVRHPGDFYVLVPGQGDGR